MQSLHAATEGGNLQATVTHVISNVPDAKGLAYAKQHNIQTSVVNHKDFNSREEFDQVLLATIDSERPPELVLLAGFMRRLTAEFTHHFSGRLINIHPSLLPAHPGLDTHHKALDSGDRWHGCSVHYVNAALDGGPLIARGVVPVKIQDTEATLAARVLATEHQLYPTVAQLCLHGGVACQDSHVTINDTRLQNPLLYYLSLIHI